VCAHASTVAPRRPQVKDPSSLSAATFGPRTRYFDGSPRVDDRRYAVEAATPTIVPA